MLDNEDIDGYEVARRLVEFVDAAEFGRIQKIAKTLQSIFERDHISGMEGKEDYLVRAVEEAKKETCPNDTFGTHNWEPFGVAGWLVCTQCHRKKPMK